jgi:hypothetical protein
MITDPTTFPRLRNYSKDTDFPPNNLLPLPIYWPSPKLYYQSRPAHLSPYELLRRKKPIHKSATNDCIPNTKSNQAPRSRSSTVTLKSTAHDEICTNDTLPRKLIPHANNQKMPFVSGIRFGFNELHVRKAKIKWQFKSRPSYFSACTQMALRSSRTNDNAERHIWNWGAP